MTQNSSHRSTGARIARALAIPALALATLGVTAAPPLAAQGAPRSAELDRAVAALRSIDTMRADFVQTDRSGQRTTGVMTLKRPGKIRFQYQKGVPLLIVSDGRALTMVDYEVRQVQRWPISNSPLGALLDPKRDVARFGKLIPTGNPAVTSIEVRDSKHPEYGMITLIFVKDPSAPGGMALNSWVALDSQNKRTTIRLANQKYGMAVPDSTFAYNDPRRNASTRR
ncbi:outer membrane lipoprotein carrier protein LolA [Novosphingobium tardum]|uniref:Outer membrane lipoprotein carrier protein LolA n=1 Tax=Novosphingobium tardum TaxID=1538021 RepID=A0ABV8RLN3_9SPHN